MRARTAVITAALLLLVAGCAQHEPRGSGDLGVIVERSAGRLQVVDTTRQTSIGAIAGLGDLSHASVVYSRDGRYAYVFGRDGGLTKVDLLRLRIERRVVQSGNSIGGAISQDGKLIAAANYTPGGVRVFDADTLELLADIPATYGDGSQRAKVVGLEDAAGSRFAFSLFEAGEIWVADLSVPRAPKIQKFRNIGRQPYDARSSPWTGATISPACSARTASPCSTCGTPSVGCGACSPVTGGASNRCRFSRCRISRAGRWRDISPICPPSAVTRCWWWTPSRGARRGALPSPGSPCS
jgi:hypothetical protein